MRGYCLLPLALWMAQAQAPVRIVRGEITQFTYAEGSGEIAIRDALYRTHSCRLSPDTWFEYNLKKTEPQNVRLTMTAEVVADTRSGEAGCVALTVYLREAIPRVPIGLLASSNLRILDGLYPRGNLIFTGTVRGLEGRELILRTRKGEEQRLFLREDTVFQHDGRVAKPGELEPQTRIHVRAGKNFDGRVEAYQITWGKILQPDGSTATSDPNPPRQ